METKNLETTKVVKYLLNNEKKNIARDIIFVLKNCKDDKYLESLYIHRAKINSAYKTLFLNDAKWL